MRSGYGSSGLYTGSPLSLPMNARGPLIGYPPSPTFGLGLKPPNMQSPNGQSLVQSPSFTQELPQSIFGNYSAIVSQTVPNAYMFPTPNMSDAILQGIDEQVSAF